MGEHKNNNKTMKSHHSNYNYRTKTEQLKHKTKEIAQKINPFTKEKEVHIQTFQNIEIKE